MVSVEYRTGGVPVTDPALIATFSAPAPTAVTTAPTYTTPTPALSAPAPSWPAGRSVATDKIEYYVCPGFKIGVDREVEVACTWGLSTDFC